MVAVGLALAFLLDGGVSTAARWAAPVFGVVLLLSALGHGPFLLLWRRAIAPRVGPPGEVEDPRPPRFAAAVGTVFLAAATVAFALGSGFVGWTLCLIVAFLAGLAAATGICVGCEVYTFIRRHSRSGWAPVA